MIEQIDQQMTVAIATELGGRFIDAKRAELTAQAALNENQRLAQQVDALLKENAELKKERDELRERVTGAEAAGDTMRSRLDPPKIEDDEPF